VSDSKLNYFITMDIGSFALIRPFSPLETQFAAIRDLGITHADITDNHDGATLGVEYGFAASVSLDSHPRVTRDLAKKYGLTLTSVCAHANLLDPASPDRYQTHQIIKAIKLAHLLGIPQVITTEGEPKTPFGHALSKSERIFSIKEKLAEPVNWAAELGVELLLEPHGPVTDTIEGMAAILDGLKHEETVGVNLDTGNCWLGGSEPLAFIKTFGTRIKHVHWKDMGSEWGAKRGSLFGCGMGNIPLGAGVVDIASVVKELKKIGFNGPTTIEVAGDENVKASLKNLREWIGT
jgi:inosose dehydratase